MSRPVRWRSRALPAALRPSILTAAVYGVLVFFITIPTLAMRVDWIEIYYTGDHASALPLLTVLMVINVSLVVLLCVDLIGVLVRPRRGRFAAVGSLVIAIGIASALTYHGARMRHYYTAARADRAAAVVELERGVALEASGDLVEARRAYDQAIEEDAYCAEALARRAWLIVTAEGCTKEDAIPAWHDVMSARLLVGGAKTIVLEARAAAWAREGNFDVAVQNQRYAVDCAVEHGRAESDIERMRDRLETYRNGKPLVFGPDTPPAERRLE